MGHDHGDPNGQRLLIDSIHVLGESLFASIVIFAQVQSHIMGGESSFLLDRSHQERLPFWETGCALPAPIGVATEQSCEAFNVLDISPGRFPGLPRGSTPFVAVRVLDGGG